MNFGKDNYTFTTTKNIREVTDLLKLNTYHKPSMMRVPTMKKFIGEIKDDSFELIGSAPKSVVTIFEGQLSSNANGTQVELFTKTRKAFLVLFAVWFGVIGLMIFVVPPLVHKPGANAGHFFTILIAAVLFRLYIHFLYLRGRKKTLGLLKEVLSMD